MRVLPVEVLDLPGAEFALVLPDDLAPVARALVRREALDDRARQLAAWLVAQVAVGDFLHLLGAHVLIGELAAHERARLVRRTDALDPLQGGQVKPLVVVLVFVGVDEQGGSSHVARTVEDEQALVASPVRLEHLHAQLALALLAVLVAQHHGLLGREVSEALGFLAGIARDLEAFLLGRRALCVRRRKRMNQNAGADREKQESSADEMSVHHFILRSMAVSRVGGSRKSAMSVITSYPELETERPVIRRSRRGESQETRGEDGRCRT